MSRKSTGSTNASSGGGSSNGAQSVKVFCRIRPSNKTEVASGGVVCVKYTEEMIEVKSEEAGEHKFNFDHILGIESTHQSSSSSSLSASSHHFVHYLHHHNRLSSIIHHDQILGMDSTQPEVFSVIAQPLIKDILRGYNATILAYGQSGTGKVCTI